MYGRQEKISITYNFLLQLLQFTPSLATALAFPHRSSVVACISFKNKLNLLTNYVSENMSQICQHTLGKFGVHISMAPMVRRTGYFTDDKFVMCSDGAILLSRAKNSGRQCHFKIWLDVTNKNFFPA
jgi:hypothetical protein